jgi:hypothetical protein
VSGVDDMSGSSYTEIDMERENSFDSFYAEIEAEALAEERTGIAQTEISRIERGRKSPTVDTYSRLAAGLDLNVDSMIRRGGEKRRIRVA